MDRKSILIIVICFVLLLLWPQLVSRIFPPKPAPVSTNLTGQAYATNLTPIAAVGIASNTTVAPSPPTPQFTMPVTLSTTWKKPDAPEELLTLETEEARYTITSHGGGVKVVEFKRHLKTVGRARKSQSDTDRARLADLNHGAAVPALALLGGESLSDVTPYRLSRTAAGIRAEKEAPGGLRVLKEFQVSTNGLLTTTVVITNAGAAPVNMPTAELVVGTATPMDPYDSGQAVRVEWYDGRKTYSADQAWFANRGLLGCVPGTPRPNYTSTGQSNVVWASVQNQFFAMVVIPRLAPVCLVAHPVDLPAPSASARAIDSRLVAKPVGYQAALAYAPGVLQPGDAIEQRIDMFAGPKEYNTLVRYGNNIDLIMGFSGFFGWIARLLLVSMNGLHALGLSYGLAIIAITVIIKALFWPLTQASTRSMKRMQLLQPQMKAIQEKYKADPKKMNMKLMEFMKQNKVSPLGGCLPILLQIPVFFGLYQMLRSAIELRGEPFLWAADLSQPDTIGEVFGLPINPLPLIMGATQLWQARLTPPSPGVDPVQQKMMQYMPLIFVFMLYNFSAGLALYWTIQNLLSILQMRLTRATTTTPGTTAPRSAQPAAKKK